MHAHTQARLVRHLLHPDPLRHYALHVQHFAHPDLRPSHEHDAGMPRTASRPGAAAQELRRLGPV